jgi:Zn-dependent protease with chaperone function
VVVPVAYAIALCVMLLARDLFFVLPGSGDPNDAAVGCAGMFAPAIVARLAQATRHKRMQRVLARLSPLLLPACYAALLGPGGWLDLCERWSGASFLAELALLLSPLLVAESLRIVVQSREDADPDGVFGLWPLLRSRFAFVALFSMPWVALAAIGDVLQADRGAFAFVVGTGIGLTLGTLAFVLLIASLLPFAFRLALGLSSSLPEPVGTQLRETAAALGFRGRAVLLLDSGMRTVNALLVGPLPWPRYLVITDGLFAVLDAHALRGVVAHEVGHAQAGHPAMLLALFVATPLLLANVGQQIPADDLASPTMLLAALVLALGALWTLRKVSHRFEHEADVLSAIALGGAEPCIQALQRVGEVVHGEPDRATMLHPSESSRVALLRRFASDQAFRARFALRGLRLRRTIAAAVFLAIVAGSLSWLRSWPHESAALAFHRGDFATARARVDAVGTNVPEAQWEWWERFRLELDAATAIAGDGGDWESIRGKLAEEGWRRGIETLLREGPAAARPWVALATEDEARSPLRRSVLLYCEAAVDADLARMDELVLHIRRLGAPAELAPVFGG